VSRTHLHYCASTFSRSHALSQAIVRKEFDKAGLDISTTPDAWEHFAANADMLDAVTNVPCPPGQTFGHVIATSNMEASAKRWTAEIMQAIAESKMVSID